jgi:DtxR family transcriptional regulator, Mn-dependent transcriptional regulator
MQKRTGSTEDYLKAVMLLGRERDKAIVTSISRFFEVKKRRYRRLSKPSESGMVEHQKYGAVALTAPGRCTARDVYHHRTTLLSFLTDVLGVDVHTAEEDASKLEHA